MRRYTRVRNLIDEIKNHIEYKNGNVEMDSLEADCLAQAWHDHKVKVRDAGNQRRISRDDGLNDGLKE